MAMTTKGQRDDAAALITKSTSALATNQAFLTPGPPPTLAELTNQVRRLTRQNNALLRLVAGMYGDHAQLVNGSDT